MVEYYGATPVMPLRWTLSMANCAIASSMQKRVECREATSCTGYITVIAWRHLDVLLQLLVLITNCFRLVILYFTNNSVDGPVGIGFRSRSHPQRRYNRG
jgi:hypothetical protein